MWLAVKSTSGHSTSLPKYQSLNPTKIYFSLTQSPTWAVRTCLHLAATLSWAHGSQSCHKRETEACGHSLLGLKETLLTSHNAWTRAGHMSLTYPQWSWGGEGNTWLCTSIMSAAYLPGIEEVPEPQQWGGPSCWRRSARVAAGGEVGRRTADYRAET